jgi:hypothetical protein
MGIDCDGAGAAGLFNDAGDIDVEGNMRHEFLLNDW